MKYIRRIFDRGYWDQSTTQEPSKWARAYFERYALSAVYGLILVRIFLLSAGSFTENKYFLCYGVCWAIALVLGPLLGWVMTLIQKRYFSDQSLLLHLFMGMALLIVVYSLNGTGLNVGVWILGAFGFTQATVTIILGRQSTNGGKNSTKIPPELFPGMFALFGIWIVSMISDIFMNPIYWGFFRWPFFIFLGWSLPWSLRAHRFEVLGNKKKPSNRLFARKLWLTDGVVFCILAFLVVDPRFPADVYHYNYYLGPLADLLAGKSLLVDINAQYGVLNFYFLEGIFKLIPIGYVSLSLVVTLLIIIQDYIFYLILIRLFGRGLFSVLVLCVLLLINHFATEGYAVGYPSTGPLRFGFIYVLMGLVILRNSHPGWKRTCWIFEAFVAACACLWSLEVCIYTCPAYLGLTLYESVDWDKKFRPDIRILFFRVSCFSSFVGMMGLWICLGTYAASGQWPEISHYLDYFSVYSNGTNMVHNGLIPIHVSWGGSWWYIVALYYLSLLVIMALTLKRKNRGQNPPHLNVLFLLTLYGIAQFLYFLGRAHPNNLFHVSMPPILLTAYWIYQLKHDGGALLPFKIRNGILLGGMVVLLLCLPGFIPKAAWKVANQSRMPSEMIRCVLRAFHDQPHDDSFSIGAARLMDHYSPKRKRLPYFLGERGIEMSLYAGKVKKYPYNDCDQAVFCKPVFFRIYDFDPHLRSGDYVYFLSDYLVFKDWKPGEHLRFAGRLPLVTCDWENPRDRYQFQRSMEIALLEKLDHSHPMEWVEQSGEVVVARLR